MEKPKDHSGLIEQNIRKLSSHLNSPVRNSDYEDLLYDAAISYASDNPGDYCLALPGILLPLFS